MSDKTGPKVHELKCHPGPFAALKSGAKTFEWRKDDRGYQVGDTLWLREWMPTNGSEAQMGDTPSYTGQFEERTVTYIIREGFGIPEGYCIMGIAAGAASKEPEARILRKAEIYDQLEAYGCTSVSVWLDMVNSKDQHPTDPDAHLTGDAYLEAKQERCAHWMKGQSAEEIEREMRGEPSKAILLPMSEQMIKNIRHDRYLEKYGNHHVTSLVDDNNGYEDALRYANTKAVSIDRIMGAIKDHMHDKGWMMIYKHSYEHPMTNDQYDSLRERLNNLKP